LMMTNDNVDDDVRVLVVIGNTGDGKSTFLNLLMNNENAFQEGISADPITEKTSVKECQWKNEKLLLCDTQGISDSQNLDNENIKQMALELKQLPYINMIILIINGSNVRVSVYLQETIKLFINIFSKQIFNHLIIAFTHWSLDQNDDTDESNIENDYNEKISKMFHITKHIPCFFIDSCYNRLNKRGKYTYDNDIKKIYDTRLDTLYGTLIAMDRLPVSKVEIKDRNIQTIRKEKQTIEINRLIEPIFKHVRRRKSGINGLISYKGSGYEDIQEHSGNKITITYRDQERNIQVLYNGQEIVGDWTTINEYTVEH
ncbi:unnamed protein product, partial [Didymodactylos carnosus]